MSDTTPDTPRTIHQTILAVMRSVRAVSKDGWNSGQKFNFRGIDGVMNAVGPAMREHGLIVFPLSVEKDYTSGSSGSGKVLHLHRLHVTFRFVNEDGDHLDVEIPSESMDSSDKGTAKAMSVALRIALLQVLALPTEDRDPDEDYHQMSSHGGAPQAQHAPVPENWRDYVAQAEQQGNLSMLEQMEASAVAHGHTEARTGIAAARLRVKRATAAQDSGTAPQASEGAQASIPDATTP